MPSERLPELPEPECPLGYPDSQLDAIFGDQRPAFNRWMNGQTVAGCEGRRWDENKREYVADECAEHPHGIVTYSHDVRRFLSGSMVWD